MMRTLDNDGDMEMTPQATRVASKIPQASFQTPALVNRKFAIVLAVFELLMIFIYGLCVDWPARAEAAVSIRYSFFMDVHAMVFVGLSFIVTFLHRYGYSAAGYNFMIAVVVIQWSILTNAFWSGVYARKFHNIKLTTENAISADYACACVLISFGCVLGKTNALQLLTMALIETLCYTFNGMVCALGMRAVDMGAMYVHVFSTFFGLGCSFFVGLGGPHEDCTSSKTSDLFSFLGTLVLWLFWPSANAALAEGPEQHKVVMNTLLALCSSTVTVFITSALLRKDNKFKISDVQNASLSGGVAIGSVASLVIRPWLALVIGGIAGILGVVGYTHVQPFLWRKFKIHDTCGINNFHGLPGILGGITGAMASARVVGLDQETIALIFPARAPTDPNAAGEIGVNPGKDRTAVGQAFVQLAALLVTIIFGAGLGSLTGLIIRLPAFHPPQQPYQDAEYWDVPSEEIGPDTAQAEELVSKRVSLPTD
eukprot:c23185_g1_i1.p1 GENE.c23185_g1_i1~~c23185_g1_i1.p1  ORF type:complete len:505 (+),score=91.91 c23185_g1_i1:69-1517(+)